MMCLNDKTPGGNPGACQCAGACLKCECHPTFDDDKNQYVDRIMAAIKVFAEHCKAGKP